jgi:hypothetical protein
MDEATLTIRFKDESSVGPAGVATTSPQYSGSDPGSVRVADQQNAITQAGGVGAMAAKNSQASAGATQSPPPVIQASPAPMAPVTLSGTSMGDPLFKTVQGIVQADPKSTAFEIAAALGIKESQAQSLLTAAGVNPGGPAPVASSAAPQVSPLTPSQQASQEAMQAKFKAKTEFDDALADMASSVEKQNFKAQGGELVKAEAVDESHGVRSAVSAIAGIAAQGGPLGAAAGQAANAAAALPGVAGALGAAAPVIAAAAPFVAAGTAALAIPLAANKVVDSIAKTALGQIGGLSPAVSQAEAEARVRQMLADQRTARTIGPEIAEGVAARSRLSAAVQESRDDLSKPLLQAQNNFLAALTILTQAMQGSVKASGLGAVAAGAAGAANGLADNVLKHFLPPPANAGNLLWYYHDQPMPNFPPPFTNTNQTLAPTVPRQFKNMPALSP